MPTENDFAESIVVVANPQGLHLRSGKQVVQAAAAFAAEIRAANLSRPSPEVDLKSILQIMQLQAHGGHQLRIWAQGDDAAAAVSALAALIGSPAPAP